MRHAGKLGWRARYIGTSATMISRRPLSRDSSGCRRMWNHVARTVAGATNQFAVVLVDARSGDRTVSGIDTGAETIGNRPT